MRDLKKSMTGLAVALTLITQPVFAQSLDRIDEDTVKVETLMEELAQPNLPTWQSVEDRILRIWSRSGSDTADLMLKRGQDAMEAENFDAAIAHLGALTDYAPDFAEGWNARATAFYLKDEFGLALADIHVALSLNPNHFGALTGLGVIYGEMGRPDLALRALEMARELNPHRPNIIQMIEQIQYDLGRATL